ncbi:hypothetical protein BMAGB8_A0442 [Burkholderia mallei GB8 horse 4]|nr:hypothetical protein BMAGB8_A0442 [Burkholderia mallei GB8 horse 4]
MASGQSLTRRAGRIRGGGPRRPRERLPAHAPRRRPSSVSMGPWSLLRAGLLCRQINDPPDKPLRTGMSAAKQPTKNKKHTEL